MGKSTQVTTHIRLGIPRLHVEKYLLRRCDRIAAVSRACKALLDGTGLEDRVEVIYNGVDVGNLGARERDQSLRREWGWSDGDLVLGLLGLVSPRKNQLVAAEAVSLAAKRGVPARLLLAGDAFKDSMEYGEKLRARIAQDDLRDRVKWLPFQKEVAPIYGAIDINLLISSEEGFGRTIIEAGAVGVPSIGARVGGIPELIVEGGTGFLVREESADDLADCIVRMWECRAELPAWGEAARRRVLAHFTIEAHVRAMIAFWERAAEQGQGTRDEG